MFKEVSGYPVVFGIVKNIMSWLCSFFCEKVTWDIRLYQTKS